MSYLSMGLDAACAGALSGRALNNDVTEIGPSRAPSRGGCRAMKRGREPQAEPPEGACARGIQRGNSRTHTALLLVSAATLGGASAAALNAVLDKRSGRAAAKAKAKLHSILPGPRRGVQVEPCGAPAQSRAAADAEADAALNEWMEPETCVSRWCCWAVVSSQVVAPNRTHSVHLFSDARACLRAHTCRGDALLIRVDGTDEDMWEDAGLEDAGPDEGTTSGDAPPSGALHIQLDTSPEGPAGAAAKPTKRPTQRKQPVRVPRRAGALLLVGLLLTGEPLALQALRRANAGDKVFADYVHRAHLLGLLARALAADAVASDPALAALVLSVLPPRVAWSLKALQPGAGVTASDMLALCEAFGTVFCILPSRAGAAPPPPPPPGARIPALADTLRDAVYRAAARKNGDAEELSILFAALCRHWGIPCRTAHALFPQPLKPDGRSLEASEGLSSNPAEWPRGGRAGRQLYQQQRGTPLRDFYGGAGPSGGQAPPRARSRPGAAAAAPKPVAVLGPPRGGGGEDEPIDLTGDDDDDVEDAGAEQQPSVKKSRRGRGGRADAELNADLQRAMAASLAGGGAPAPGAAVTPEGGKKPAAARKWTVGDAAWSRARGHIRHWVEVYIGGVPPHGAWVALFPWERVSHSAAKGKGLASAAAGSLQGTEALDITAVAEVSATAQAKQPLAYVIAAAGGGCRDVTRRYARQWSASQAARTHEPWWMDTLYGLTRAEAAATSAAVDVLAHPWPGAGAAVVAAEDRDLKAAVLKEPLPQRVADYKGHPLYALERHLTRYQAIWPREPVGSFNDEDVFARTAVQELHTADVWQRLHGRQVLPDQLATPAKVIPRRGVVAAAKKAANQPGNVGWGGTSGLGFDVAPVGTSFGDEDDYDAAGAGMDPVAGHEEEEAEGEARGGRATSPNGAAGGEAAPLHEDEKTILYGLWQTKAWAQPGAQGGKVPRNEYGNVDLLRGNPVPPGCVHLKGYARIGALAARLGIDAVPALTGFERHGGRMVPTIDGVVVAVENQQQLVDTWLQEEEQRNEKQLAKRRAEALKKWRLLVRTYVQKERLNADGAGPSGAAAAGPEVVCLDSDGEDVTPAAAAGAPKPPAVQRGGAEAEVEQM